MQAVNIVASFVQLPVSLLSHLSCADALGAFIETRSPPGEAALIYRMSDQLRASVSPKEDSLSIPSAPGAAHADSEKPEVANEPEDSGEEEEEEQ